MEDLDRFLTNIDNIEIEGKKRKSSLAEAVNKTPAVCESCGKAFQQNIYTLPNGEKKATQYKYCEKCRKKVKIKSDTVQTKEATIKYEPYEWQKRFHASKARCKVISGAARSGKDRASVMEFTYKFLDLLNEDRDQTYVPKVHAWIIAPTYRLVKQLMREVMNTFPSIYVTHFDKEAYAIETINGGLIEFRSADDPDSLVSVGLDIVWITEAARIKDFDVVIGNIEDRLSSPGRGKNGEGGFLLINSSPRGRRYFNVVCKWGNVGSATWRPGWETFYISRWDNPTYAKKRHQKLPNGRTYEEDLKLSRSDRQYQEDILGLPSDEEGSQFPNFRDYAVTEKVNLPEQDIMEFKRKLNTPVYEYTYSIGYDPAKQIDGACAVVYCEQTGDVVEMERYEKMDYQQQINIHLSRLSKKWNNAIIRYGKTGLGEALEPFFQNAGLNYIPYAEQGRNKERMVENLTTLVKNGRFRIYNVEDICEAAIRQFEDYGYFLTDKNNISYGNMTKGGHDDFVSASYFATADINASMEETIVNTVSDDCFEVVSNELEGIQESCCGFF